MKTLIIIPTYNERDNIQELIIRILALNINNLDILVVDDNSPDKTSKVIGKLMKQFNNIHLIKRKSKLGLGSAYIEGFKFAIKNGYGYIFEMDADFSHNPKDIPKLLSKAQSGHGLVIGSRRIKDGKIVGWNFVRHFYSFSANLFARLFLKLKTKDATAGFRCFSGQTLQKIQFESIKSNGYAFQEETVYLCEKNNIKISEVPVTFIDRKKGKSKLGKKEILEFFKTIFRLSKFDYYTIVFISFILFLITWRLHNAFYFNPYWGYDGGGHLDYIFSISKNNKIPSIDDNYIAWHEPLYYFLASYYHKIVSLFSGGLNLKWLSLLQVVISLSTTYLSCIIIKLLTTSRATILSSFVLINILPAMIQASVFTTNELLNYFFHFLLLFIFLKYFYQNTPQTKHFILLGIISGLALLTKITAIILIVLIFSYVLIRLPRTQPCNKVVVRGISAIALSSRPKQSGAEGSKAKVGHSKSIIFAFLLSCFLAFLIILPWQIYRHNHVLSDFSINNYQYLQKLPLKLDNRINFYTNIDFNIFKFPYWYSGATSFTSMLYADTFYDYYGVMQNQDLLNATDKQNLTPITPQNFVTKTDVSITKKLVYLAITPFIIMLLGLISLIYNSIKKRRLALFSLLTLIFYLSALIYYSYVYHYPEMGVVKSIFILPAFIFPIVYGFDFVNKQIAKKRYFYAIIYLGLIPYIYFLIKLFWVTPYNY
jgi:dolichol-phosphate mannosyltransferase